MKIIFLILFLCFVHCAWSADYEIVEKIDSISIETSSFATEHHQQTVKILTQEGAGYREYLPVNSFIQIRNISCTVVLSNGRTSSLRKDDIVELPVSESANMMTDYKLLLVAPPDLEPGAIVKLAYDRQISSLLYLDPWVYGTSVPIRKASCSVVFPPHITLKYRGSDATVKIQKSELAGKTHLAFETAKQKAISLYGQSENLGTVEKKVVFMPEQCLTEKWALSTKSWQTVADWFSELSKFAYQEDPSMNAVIQDITTRNTDPEKVAQAIYEYIQKNYVYTAIEIGIGGYKPRFAAQTFQKKYGDCKDLTLLYLALLKKAGIEGYPALVDTRSRRFFYEDFPSPTQFNHCIAFLPKIRNGVWVDSTVKNFRLGEVPSVIQGKYALVAGGPNTLMKIPEDLTNSNVFRFQLKGEFVEKELKIKGEVQTLGQASLFPDTMKNALKKSSIQHYIYTSLLQSGYPVQHLEANYKDSHSLSLSFTTPVTELQPYRVMLLNVLRYAALERLAMDPQQGEYFGLGNPVRLIFESTIGLAGHRLISNPIENEKNGEYVNYRMKLSETEGSIRYALDAYFSNGFLDDLQMKKYQQELQDFSSHLERTVVIQ